MTEQEFIVVETMAKYGGSFVKALAECFRRADYNNFRKLKDTFSEYWQNYERMATAKTKQSSTKGTEPDKEQF